MQAYLASQGPRVKALPPGGLIQLSDDYTTRDICFVTEAGGEGLCCNKVCKSRLVFRGSVAQTQTSYEDTLFPIGFAALRQFNASFHDIQTTYLEADATTSASSSAYSQSHLVDHV